MIWGHYYGLWYHSPNYDIIDLDLLCLHPGLRLSTMQLSSAVENHLNWPNDQYIRVIWLVVDANCPAQDAAGRRYLAAARPILHAVLGPQHCGIRYSNKACIHTEIFYGLLYIFQRFPGFSSRLLYNYRTFRLLDLAAQFLRCRNAE
jgi:hypothetical protein